MKQENSMHYNFQTTEWEKSGETKYEAMYLAISEWSQG